jgi:protein-tyrosine phosphatase
MNEIHSDLLWLGHAFDVREPKPLFEFQIRAVVDVAFEEPCAQLPRQLSYCRFPLNDGGGNDPGTIVQAVHTLTGFLKSGVRTLVACSAGMSRSPTIAAFALGDYLSENPATVLERIAGMKPIAVNGKFWNDVAEAIKDDGKK